MSENNEILLTVKGLSTHFYTEQGKAKAVQQVGFSIKKGKTFALVGESGCGKSVTAYSILRLIQKPGKIVAGKILLYPKDKPVIDIISLGKKSQTLYKVRG
ncbi:MAG: ATP-binding cassette domain-containing protein, partial [Planctomycetes bacterium]|nr:ATP-binding cassette domain-containing protein [Planctomycetota bacterium]